MGTFNCTSFGAYRPLIARYVGRGTLRRQPRGYPQSMFHVKRAVLLAPDYTARSTSIPGDASSRYLSPLLAVIVGIVHAALAPVIVIGGVKPNSCSSAVVLVTCFAGFLPGITWAFVAGLTANLLVGDPLGSIPLGHADRRGAGRRRGAALGAHRVDLPGRRPRASGRSWRTSSRSGSRRWSSEASVRASPADLILAAAVLNAAI